MYDVIVIGAGIAGIHVATSISSNNKVLLLETNPYVGGNIYTMKHPHYEVGAARFNKNHPILLSLIHKHKLTPIPISSHVEYLEMDNAEEYYLSTMKKITSIRLSSDLHTISFYQYCKDVLSSHDANLLMNIFGYYSEFKTMSAYEAIKSFKHDFIGQPYYVLKEGLSELCKRMLKGTTVEVQLKSKVDTVIYNAEDTCYHVDHYKTKKIIFAIPPSALKQFPICKAIFPLLKGIIACPLLRIYAIYDPVWFKGMPRMTTSSILRHIIPVNEEKGLIMISYLDGEDIRPFMNGSKLKSTNVIMGMIQKELHKLFPDKLITKPTYFKCHYWKIGTHVLRPKFPDTRKLLINPIRDIYLCGEAYSYKHGWMEGALESAEKVIHKITKT